MRVVRLAGPLLAAVLVLMLFAGSALAAKPTVIFKNEQLPSDPFIDTETCPGLEILNDGEIFRSRTLYFDNEGNETRLVIHVRYRLTFTNLANGLTLSSPGVRNIEIDFVNGTWTESGVYRNTTAAGHGTVEHVSGRSVEDLETEELILLAGPHDVDLAALCGALAGD